MNSDNIKLPVIINLTDEEYYTLTSALAAKTIAQRNLNEIMTRIYGNHAEFDVSQCFSISDSTHQLTQP